MPLGLAPALTVKARFHALQQAFTKELSQRAGLPSGLQVFADAQENKVSIWARLADCKRSSMRRPDVIEGLQRRLDQVCTAEASGQEVPLLLSSHLPVPELACPPVGRHACQIAAGLTTRRISTLLRAIAAAQPCLWRRTKS